MGICLCRSSWSCWVEIVTFTNFYTLSSCCCSLPTTPLSTLSHSFQLSLIFLPQEECRLSCWTPPGVCVGCVYTMASLLRVVAASCSAPVFSGVSCMKLQNSHAIKTPCIRFFRTHQALRRCASPGKTLYTFTGIWRGRKLQNSANEHSTIKIKHATQEPTDN